MNVYWNRKEFATFHIGLNLYTYVTTDVQGNQVYTFIFTFPTYAISFSIDLYIDKIEISTKHSVGKRHIVTSDREFFDYLKSILLDQLGDFPKPLFTYRLSKHSFKISFVNTNLDLVNSNVKTSSTVEHPLTIVFKEVIDKPKDHQISILVYPIDLVEYITKAIVYTFEDIYRILILGQEITQFYLFIDKELFPYYAYFKGEENEHEELYIQSPTKFVVKNGIKVVTYLKKTIEYPRHVLYIQWRKTIDTEEKLHHLITLSPNVETMEKYLTKVFVKNIQFYSILA